MGSFVKTRNGPQNHLSNFKTVYLRLKCRNKLMPVPGLSRTLIWKEITRNIAMYIDNYCHYNTSYKNILPENPLPMTNFFSYFYHRNTNYN